MIADHARIEGILEEEFRFQRRPMCFSMFGKFFRLGMQEFCCSVLFTNAVENEWDVVRMVS